MLDESALTGEPLPVTRGVGEGLRSRAVNAGAPFDMAAWCSAVESTLRVSSGWCRRRSSRGRHRSASPIVRRHLGVSGDPVRGLAVMVVTTPSTLILGVPVAVVSGLSRCAARGVLVKGGGVLE